MSVNLAKPLRLRNDNGAQLELERGGIVRTLTVNASGVLVMDGTQNLAIVGGSINGTPIGGTTASTGAFTTVSASTSVTTPLVTRAGTLALSATGANVVTASTNGVERLRVDSAGNLLIGTNTAANNLRLAQKLAVVHAENNTIPGMAITGYTGTSATGRPILEFNRSRGVTDQSFTSVQSGDSLGSVIFRGTDGVGFHNAATIEALTGGSTATDSVPGVLRFLTTPAAGTAVAERMRIDSAGNLLVGTTNLLSGTGNTTSGMSFNPGSDSQLYISGGAADNIVCQSQIASGTVNKIAFIYNASVVGRISSTSTTTTYATSSDYRLKHDIQPMTGALAKVATLKPVTYKWNADDSSGEGFIAHELAEIVPYAVTGEKDGEQMQGVDYGKLTTLLVAAVKELKAEIEQLKGATA